MKLLHSSIAGFTVKTIFAGLLMLGLVACPENPDLIPDSFTVPPVTGAALGVDTSSAPFTVSGITAAVPISVIGGKYQIDSAPFTSTSGTVSAGQTVKVSIFSSVNFGTTKTASITVGGVTGTFSVITLAADTTPEAFSFTAVTGAALSTTSVSNPITVAGVNTDAPISISSGGEYSIDSTTDFVNTPGTVKNAQVVRVRATSSNAFNTPVNVTLTIGGVTGTFTVTTRPADITPDAFSFAPVTNAEPKAVVTSAAATISGIESAAKVVVSQGEYSINDGAFTGAEGTITNSQSIKVRGTASSSFSTASEVILSIGGVSTIFTITTRAIDSTPDAFTISDLSQQPLGTLVASSTVQLTGFDSAPISVSAGGYKINNGAFTNQPGTIQNGDTLTLQLLSSAVNLVGTQMDYTIGGFKGTWTVVTTNLLTVDSVETLPIAIADGTGSVNSTRVYGPASVVHFNVPATALKLARIRVRVKVNHTYRNDLDIRIFAPDSSSNIIFTSSTNIDTDNIDVTFDDSSLNQFVQGCLSSDPVPNCIGVIKPFNPFSTMSILNLDPQGTWRIEIRDGTVGDTGNIVALGLVLTMKP